MSAYSEFQIKDFKDRELLIAALTAMGYSPAFNARLSDHWNEYRGNAPTVDILIPKGQLRGTYDDVGFKRNADGSYSAVIGDMDRRRGCDDSWLAQLKGHYMEAGVIRQAKKIGLIPVSRKVNNGKVTLVYQRA